MKNTVVIVDDHMLITKALKEIIEKFEKFEVLYECENGRDLQEKIVKYPVPDIILLDISMPLMNGFETAKWLHEAYPDVLIMALTMHDDEKSVVTMVKNGAKAYMLKNSHPVALEKALLGMINQGYYYPDWASSMVFDSLNGGNPNITPSIILSDREKELLKYITTEMGYKEIADAMFVSPRTVEGYRDSLCEKLSLKSRVGLAVYAIKNGFVE